MSDQNTAHGASSAEGAPRSKPEPKKVRGVFERVKGSNVWWIYYYDQFSKRHYEKVGSRAVAIAAYQKRKTDIREGRFVGIRPKRISWRELCDDLQTRGFHKPGLLDAVRSWFGDRIAASITPQDIHTKLNGLTAAGLAPATVNRHRAMCSSVFSWAISNGKAATNPIPKVKRLRENNERVRYLAPEEEMELRLAIRELAPDQRHLCQLIAHQLGSGHHGLQLATGHVAGQVLHPAVGGDDQALRRDVLEPGADTGRDRVRRLDLLVK